MSGVFCPNGGAAGHPAQSTLDTVLAASDVFLCNMCGNFDIISDRLSRIPQLFTTLHVPRGVFLSPPPYPRLSDADWGV